MENCYWRKGNSSAISKEAVSNGLAYITEDQKKGGAGNGSFCERKLHTRSINSARISKEFLNRLRLLRFSTIRRIADYVKKLILGAPQLSKKLLF